MAPSIPDLFREVMASKYGLIVAVLFVVLGAAQYLLGPKQDWVESRRRRILLRLHEVLSLFGGYAAVTKSLDEYVFTVVVPKDEIAKGETGPEDVVERGLYGGVNPYHRNLIAAAKTLALPNGTKLASEGSWVHRPSLLADYQWHVTLFPHPTRDRAYLALQHKELSWVRHPVKHYLNPKQTDGDPGDVLKDTIESSPLYIEYESSGEVMGNQGNEQP